MITRQVGADQKCALARAAGGFSFFFYHNRYLLVATENTGRTEQSCHIVIFSENPVRSVADGLPVHSIVGELTC